MTTFAFAPAPEWSPAQRAARAPLDRERSLAIAFESAHQVPEWLDRTVARLNELGVMHHGWDGAGARPPTQTAGVAALRAVMEIMSALDDAAPVPAIVPMFDGGIQLEWHSHDLDIEITVQPDGNRHVWLSANDGLIEIDEVFRGAVDDVRKHLGSRTRG